jgi:hypothetical protein
MNNLKNYEMGPLSWKKPGEINFILLDSTPAEISSPQPQKTFKSDFTDIYKNNPTGTLLLPFMGSSHEVA